MQRQDDVSISVEFQFVFQDEERANITSIRDKLTQTQVASPFRPSEIARWTVFRVLPGGDWI